VSCILGRKLVDQTLYNRGLKKLVRIYYTRRANSTRILRIKCKASQNKVDRPTFLSLDTNKNVRKIIKILNKQLEAKPILNLPYINSMKMINCIK